MQDFNSGENQEIKRMIPYNTGMKKLVLHEYGRLIHELADAALKIEDRELRTEFAAMVVDAMKSTVQDKSKDHDDKKYWDHLHIMTGFQLDIDGPYEAPQAEAINKKPEKIPYTASSFGRRHYGLVLQKMIRNVAAMENGEEKDLYVDLLSNHVKKLLTINNPENANDSQVFKDIAEISNGCIVLSPDLFSLLEYKEDKQTKQSKKKK